MYLIILLELSISWYCYISETMQEFAEKTEKLKELMKNTVESIEGISSGVVLCT